MNILDITMNSDKYHRKSTLDDTRAKIDSMMRTIVSWKSDKNEEKHN